ncbi:hypothetical protein AB0I60_01475 [Actinosynnema sp. NPDC050436]|uniref:hypothetical protein n=1 Tax=Actinosynnema sp. NPDC050436 TaxID=3155659 RepID=UPI0033CDC315
MTDGSTGDLVGGVLVIASLLVVLGCAAWRYRDWRALAATAGPRRPFEAGLDFYELATLTRLGYSSDDVVHVALARMHTEGRLRVVSKKYREYRFEVVDRVPRDDEEAAVLDHLEEHGGVLTREGEWALGKDPRVRAVPHRLLADGLVAGEPPPGVTDQDAIDAWWVRRQRLVVVASGVPPVFFGLGVPVAVVFGSWLPLIVHAVLLAVAIPVSRNRFYPNGATLRFRRAMVDSARNRPLTGKEDLVRKVALFGLDHLPEDHPLRPAPGPPAPPRPAEPEPVRQPPPDFNFDSPGLGGL